MERPISWEGVVVVPDCRWSFSLTETDDLHTLGQVRPDPLAE